MGGDRAGTNDENGLEAMQFVSDFADAFAQNRNAALVSAINGGSGAERTLARNQAAFDDWALVPRALTGTPVADLSVDLFGSRVPLPFFVSPTGSHRLLNPEGEAATARATAACGGIFVRSALADCSLEEVASAGGRRWQQLNMLKERGLMLATIQNAAEHGYEAICLTVDSPVRARRRWDPVSLGLAPSSDPHSDVDATFSWRSLEELMEQSPLPIIVKGITSTADAVHAVELGVAAVFVSNHGGRQLDGAQSTLAALPGISSAIGGRVPVLFDGGCRSGTDVVTALALGATAVGLGRVPLWGLALGGQAGVQQILDIVRAEVVEAVTLTGAGQVRALNPDNVSDRRDSSAS